MRKSSLDPVDHFIIMVIASLIGAGISMCGCKKEGKKVREAYEKVFEYSDSIQGKRTRIILRRRLPKDVWSARENLEIHNRPRLEVELDMPFNAKPEQIRKRLHKVTMLAKQGTHYKAIRVRAWPEKLRRYGGIMGVNVLSPDGGGWANEKVSYRQMKITLNAQSPKLTKHEHSILAAMETIHMELLKKKKLRKLAKKKPEKFEQIVVQKVSELKGLTSESVAKMLVKSRTYYLQVPF